MCACVLFVVYEKYSASIRQEYSHLDSKEYYQRRKSVIVLCLQILLFNLITHTQVLQKFLSLPKIFSTSEFYEVYEDVARSNMNNEILSSPSSEE